MYGHEFGSAVNTSRSELSCERYSYQKRHNSHSESESTYTHRMQV